VSTRFEGIGVVWLVRLLVIIGMLAGVAMIGLAGISLSGLRAERHRTLEQEAAMLRLVAELHESAVTAHASIQSLLEPHASSVPERASLAAFERAVGEVQGRMFDDDREGDVAALEQITQELVALWDHAVAWQRQHARVESELPGSLVRARELERRLRIALETLEGRWRLEDAVRTLGRRTDPGRLAAPGAGKPVEGQTSTRMAALRNARADLATLAVLTEVVSGEAEADRLPDLKDNQIQPALERLRRSIPVLARAADAPPELTATAVEQIAQALLGAGYRVDAAHQTVLVGEDGLYAVRDTKLGLEQEQEGLRLETLGLWHKAEELLRRLTERAGQRSRDLGRQAEERLGRYLDRILGLWVVLMVGFLLMGTLISRRVRCQVREIADLHRHNALVLASAAEGIYGLDSRGNTTFVNPAAANMLGWAPEELIGQPHHTLVHHSHSDGAEYPQEECPVHRTLRDGEARQVADDVFWRKDGSSVCVEYTSTPIRGEGGVVEGVVMTVRDITERKAAERALREKDARLERLANYDTLTGLVNRRLFLEHLRLAMRRARRNERLVGLMFMDLDHFKQVNDGLGHAAGDQVLRKVATRLRRVLRETDIIARLGGDEFTVILEEAVCVGDICQVGERVLAALNRPLRAREGEIQLSVSIGVAFYPFDDRDSETQLLRYADLALYAAKHRGRNQTQLFDCSVSESPPGIEIPKREDETGLVR